MSLTSSTSLFALSLYIGKRDKKIGVRMFSCRTILDMNEMLMSVYSAAHFVALQICTSFYLIAST